MSKEISLYESHLFVLCGKYCSECSFVFILDFCVLVSKMWDILPTFVHATCYNIVDICVDNILSYFVTIISQYAVSYDLQNILNS